MCVKESANQRIKRHEKRWNPQKPTHTHTHTHTHTCNPWLAKFLAFSLAAIFPLFSSIADTPTPDIGASDSTANCDSGVLHSTTGPTAFQAEWSANTININWYADSDTDSAISVTNSEAGTCTYDGAITLPTNTLSKTGYTFAGWQVRQTPKFDLSTLNTSTNGSVYGYSRLNGNAGENESTYGLTVGSGEWAVEFDYGTVNGIAKCSAKSGNNHSYAWGGNSADWLATETELTSTSGEAKYCWCKATAFDAEKDGNYTPVSSVASPWWVFNYNLSSASYCAGLCATYCANYGQYRAAFRSALFGVQ